MLLSIPFNLGGLKQLIVNYSSIHAGVGHECIEPVAAAIRHHHRLSLFFVPLTLGLGGVVAILETLYLRRGNEVYKRMTNFGATLFLINFAMGVVTGIVQEFQFGMNWSEYSRFVGDIFGAPLAMEALLAFFLKSTFLGVWIFGWDRLSKKAHAAAIWLVAIGSNLSALFILMANAFMQHPVGYIIESGRAVMNDFGALVANPNVWVQFPHRFSPHSPPQHSSSWGLVPTTCCARRRWSYSAVRFNCHLVWHPGDLPGHPGGAQPGAAYGARNP